MSRSVLQTLVIDADSGLTVRLLQDDAAPHAKYADFSHTEPVTPPFLTGPQLSKAIEFLGVHGFYL